MFTAEASLQALKSLMEFLVDGLIRVLERQEAGKRGEGKGKGAVVQSDLQTLQATGHRDFPFLVHLELLEHTATSTLMVSLPPMMRGTSIKLRRENQLEITAKDCDPIFL